MSCAHVHHDFVQINKQPLIVINTRRIHTQERSRFPLRLKYRDILRLFRQAKISR